MAPLAQPPADVDISISHPRDFELAERCIDGDVDAMRQLQMECSPQVVAYLIKAGADLSQAQEIVDQLWADLMVAPAGELPKLTRYDGSCRLTTWLNTVATNRLLTARRSQKRREAHIAASLDAPRGDAEDENTVGSQLAAPDADYTEIPLVELLRGAIQSAFSACSAETFVLLQLAHGDGLLLRELGQIWGCSPATVSRRLEQATTEIAHAVHAYIRAADPLLELTWNDFVQLCRTANLGTLGFN